MNTKLTLSNYAHDADTSWITSKIETNIWWQISVAHIESPGDECTYEEGRETWRAIMGRRPMPKWLKGGCQGMTNEGIPVWDIDEPDLDLGDLVLEDENDALVFSRERK